MKSFVVFVAGFLAMQSDSSLSVDELSHFIGCWAGSLTYLDYTSGKPYSMPANLRVTKGKISNSFIYSTDYPNEPKANSVDTVVISDSGKVFRGEPIKTKRIFSGDSLVVTTEIEGVDGNEHKKALIRHVYTFAKKTFAVKKEVKSSGEEKWVRRNEYAFRKAKSCD